MSERLRDLVREVASGDMSAGALARAIREQARTGGGVSVADIGWGEWDVGEVFKYAEGWSLPDVDRVLWNREGENDGDEWAALALLSDGRWGFVQAGCDYTGWG